jgi:hypothetical protein
MPLSQRLDYYLNLPENPLDDNVGELGQVIRSVKMFMEEDVFCGPQVFADLQEVPFYSRLVSEVQLSKAIFDDSSLKSSRYISIYLFNLSQDFRTSSSAGFLMAYFPAKGISSISLDLNV